MNFLGFNIFYWIPISIIFGLFFGGFRVIKEWEEGLIYTLGKYKEKRQAGLKWIFPMVQTITCVDLRVRTLDVEPQEGMTQDSVPVNLDAIIYFKVIDTFKAINKVEDFVKASYKLGQTALRDVVGKKDLAYLLANKDELGKEIMSQIQKPTDEWGIEITGVEIKDVVLPKSMKRAMAKEAEASREKKARIIKAEGELEASKKLKEASKNMDGNSMILRQLQTWQEIGAEQNSTIIVAPSDLISTFKKITGGSK